MATFIQQITRWAGTLWVALALLTGAAALNYSNALHNGFLLDDHTFFYSDMKMATPRLLLNYFLPDMRRSLDMDKIVKGASYYRPLAHIIPTVCYMAFGSDVFKYHLVNWFLFVGLCFTLYYFVLLVTRDPVIALVTAMFFCVHPINSLMINYITADVFSVQLLLMLGSAIFFWKNSGGPFSVDIRISLLCFVFAVMCHETAMAMPFYLAVLLFLQSREGRGNWRALAPFFIFLACYAVFRMSFASLSKSIISQYPDFHVNAVEYAASLLRLIGWYVSRLFYPDGIVLIWVTPPVREWAWGCMILLGGVLAGLVAAARYYYRTDRVSLAAMVWFLIGILPVGFATLLMPKHGFMFEPHWMFFASIGFFIWFAIALRKLTARYFLIVVLVLLVPLITVSRAYNVLWSDEEKYCLYWLQQAPDYPPAMFYLATLYSDQGRNAEARILFKKYGHDWGILNNLGLMDLREKNYAAARENFERALKDYPNAALVYTNLGILESETGHPQQARQNWLRSIELNHYLLQPRYLVAEDDIRRQDFAPAIRMLRENLEIELNDGRSLFDLVLVYLVTNQRGEAVETARRIMAHSHDQNLLNKLAAMTAQFGLAVGDMYH